MTYPRMHDWEHCIHDTSRTTKGRVFGKIGIVRTQTRSGLVDGEVLGRT